MTLPRVAPDLEPLLAARRVCATRDDGSVQRERKPWYDRRLGPWGRWAAVLVISSIVLGFVLPRTAGWLAIEGALLVGGAACYLIGLVRSPD